MDILNPINRWADQIEEHIARWRNGEIQEVDDNATFRTVATSGEPRGEVELDLVNVFYSVKMGEKKKRLLISANLHISSGEMCAIMGPSGSGKSTLMDLIANRKKVGEWSGSILVNKKPRDRSFKRLISYVLQDDVHIPILSVVETLRYASWTRMPHYCTNEEREKRVFFLLEEMGLTKFKDTLIGNDFVPGISGGQKKRVSIAVEIMSSPTFIFLDEPTSGLDSSISLETMKSVRHMVDKTRICLCTIHQPSPEIFALFDRLILVSAGRIIYSGNVKDVPEYFTNLGYTYMEGINPAEYMIEICASAEESPEELQLIFEDSKYFTEPCEAPTDNRYGFEGSSDTNLRSTFRQQCYMLLHRSLLTSVRDRANNIADVVKNIFFGLLVGITFFSNGALVSPFFENNIDDITQLIPCTNVKNFTGLLFFIFLFQWYGNTQSIPVLCQMDVLYRRELAAGAYSVSPYAIVTQVAKLPTMLVLFTIFYCIMYPMCQFPSNGGYFFLLYIILFLNSIMSYFISMAVAGLVGDAPLAFAIVPPLFVPFGIFCGYPINLNNMNMFWGWFGPYISFMRWTFESYIINEFTTKGEDGAEAINFYKYRADFNPSSTIWILILFIVCISFITVYALQPKKSHLKRILMEEQIGVRLDVESRKSIHEVAATIPKDEQIERFSVLRLDSFMGKNKKTEESEGIDLSMVNLCYNVPKADGTPVRLLTDINGTIEAGKMCAIMGGSGAGKTTLLNVLRNQPKQGKVTGHILFNGEPFNDSLFRNIAFVPQSDVHLALLTVRETLFYAAELRIGYKQTKEFREERVNRILEILELTPHANTLVGNAYIKGVSGGQKRRLSIGVEIITFPGLIILDEPTTGLDCALSNEVMAAIKNLSVQNRTVICTIHQPSPDSFKLFDILILLAAGKLIYFGRCEKSVRYFTDSPFKFEYQEGMNPADFVVAVAGSFMKSHDGHVVTGEELTNYYESIHGGRKPDFVITGSYGEVKLTFPNSFGTQMKILTSRYSTVFYRNKPALIISIVRVILIAIIVGTVGEGTSDEGYNIYKSLYSFSFYSIFFAVISQVQAIPVFFQDSVMFYREKSAKVYQSLAYWSSIWVVYLIFNLLPNFLFVIITYFCTHTVNWNAGGFFLFYAVLYFSSLCAYFICNLITAYSPNPQTAMGIYPVMTFVNVLFSGYFQEIPNMQNWLKYWVPNLSFMRWGYQSLVCNLLTDNPRLPSAERYLSNNGFTTVNDYESFLILVGFTLTFFIGLVLRMHAK